MMAATSYFTVRRNWAMSSWIAPALTLSILPTLCWSGSYFKPEFVAVPLSFLAFSIYISRGLSNEKTWIPWAATFAALGILVKLTAVGALIGIGSHLVWDRRYRDAFRFAILVLAPVTILFWIWTAISSGGVWTMCLGANLLRPVWSELLDFLSQKYLINPILIVATACCPILFAGSRGKRSADSAVAFYFSAAFVFFLFSAAKPGSGYSYFLEAGAGMVLVLVAIIGRLREREVNAYQIVMSLLAIGLATNLRALDSMNRWNPPTLEHSNIVKRLSTLSVPQGSYIMADVQYSLDIIRAGHIPLVNDNVLYQFMVENGKLSKFALPNFLRRGKVPFILLERPVDDYRRLRQWWAADVLTYISDYYNCEDLKNRAGTRVAIGCTLKSRQEEVSSGN
jgi:hypothetical protein